VTRACALRGLLQELTDALAVAERDDDVTIDADGHVAWIDSTLDDVDQREQRERRERREGRGAGLIVLRPDGLWEWGVRRDFVRALARGSPSKRRLAATLAGPKTRRRFEVALSTVPALERDFDLHRRRRLRGWAARVLRVHVAASDVRRELDALAATARSAAASARPAAAAKPELTPRQRALRQKRRARLVRRNRRSR
jgi:hypothetical protein